MLPLLLSLLQRWRKPDDAITENIELLHHRGGTKVHNYATSCIVPPTPLYSPLSTL